MVCIQCWSENLFRYIKFRQKVLISFDIGQNLAILEALVAILLVVKRYKFHQVPGRKIEILNLVTLSMKDGLKATVEKRNAC
jgi:thiamine transporter ThiT